MPNYPWVEELDFTIEEWTPTGSIIEMLGRIHLYEMAAAAYEAAIQMRPTAIIRMRRGAMTLRARIPGASSPEASRDTSAPRRE